MIVHRESDIAPRGKIVGAAALVIVQAHAVVPDQHGGPHPLARWSREMSGHRQTIDIVANPGCCNLVHVDVVSFRSVQCTKRATTSR